MKRLFLWFYCLPISDVVILMVMATAVCLLLREKLGRSVYWKVGVGVMLACWMAVILLGTLGQRSEGRNLSEPILTPFYSYYTALRDGTVELYRTNFMNAVLFYPAGLLGCELLPKDWKRPGKVLLTVCLLGLASFVIECCQYRFSLGLAETDDVIHNILGALLGALSGSVRLKLDRM